jgi:hypothetical protein
MITGMKLITAHYNSSIHKPHGMLKFVDMFFYSESDEGLVVIIFQPTQSIYSVIGSASREASLVLYDNAKSET